MQWVLFFTGFNGGTAGVGRRAAGSGDPALREDGTVKTVPYRERNGEDTVPYGGVELQCALAGYILAYGEHVYKIHNTVAINVGSEKRIAAQRGSVTYMLTY